MQTCTDVWTADLGWRSGGDNAFKPELALCFASKAAIAAGCAEALAQRAPDAIIATCSTGGEIFGEEVVDAAAVVAFARFAATRLKATETQVDGPEDSVSAGRTLARALREQDLRLVFLLSDGLCVNGARLIEGLREELGNDTMIVGGLAGDGSDFKETLVGLGSAIGARRLAAIGFYGDALRVGASSHGGWDSFGPERRITRANGAVLYELDGQAALSLYKRYLGDEAANLPASALLYPLSIRANRDSEEMLTRTIVGVNEEDQSLIFAGEMPEGWIAQLMRGVPDRIVGGAAHAAQVVRIGDVSNDRLGVLISCIGRKLMLGQRVQDEVEAVSMEWPGVPTIGFYSYGEIGPHGITQRCMLHNQTMTTLLIGEAA